MRLLQEDMYLDLLNCLINDLETKSIRKDRTQVGCASRFGDQLRFNLDDEFPLLTTKRVFWKGVFEELAWMLRGDTNVESLQEKGVNIWNEWALKSNVQVPVSGQFRTDFDIIKKGELGPVYGAMWRKWPSSKTNLHIDQISNIINEIKSNPTSRRLVVSSWNPELVPNYKTSHEDNVILGKQALPPCHCLFQFFVEDEYLSCQLYQRSADIFLGVPFNIASYSLLTYIVANICDLKPKEFIHTFGDLHLYSNHIDAAKEQCERDCFNPPKLKINKKLSLKDLNNLNIQDFELINYNPHASIKAPIAV